jgi:predicted RNase H-like nuclease
LTIDPTGTQTWVAGVDGCRGGWLVVMRPLHDPAQALVCLKPDFAQVLALSPAPAIIAIDMPIGLADRTSTGGRPADVAARANLGARQSAVFAVPSRAAVMEVDYRSSCAVALATSEPPRKVSKQCFNLFAKIREIDAVMTADLQSRVVEVHPELAFWALNGNRPLAEPKKVKSRPYEPGLALRRGLLADAGYSAAFLEEGAAFPARSAGADDFLDAAACSWSAARIALGQGVRFPETPGRDAKGLRMEIWC